MPRQSSTPAHPLCGCAVGPPSPHCPHIHASKPACLVARHPQAKTIDLCNNPKTKEPKLSAARRIIGPLWEQLDAEQEAVTRRVQVGGLVCISTACVLGVGAGNGVLGG